MFNEAITNLNLDPIIVKVMDNDEGLGWSLSFAKQVAQEYKKYLTLCLENPDFPVVPSAFVDDFWHFHILDTLKYQEDCSSVFGYFLHHFPYFGMRGKQDEENLKKAWSDSCTLYENRFGKIDEAIWSKSKRCPNCGRRCASTSFMKERPRLTVA